MSRYARHSLVMLVIAALGFAGPVMATAGADVAAPGVGARFVGSYAFHTTIDGIDGHSTGKLVVHDDGTATDGTGGSVAHWTNVHRNFSMTVEQPTVVTVFWGTLSATGIGTRQHPGTWYSEAGFGGTWYAVRKP